MMRPKKHFERIRKFILDWPTIIVVVFVLAVILWLTSPAQAGSADQSLCQQHNYDVYHIARSAMRAEPKQDFIAKVEIYRTMMTPERTANLLRWIEEAYSSTDVTEWKRVNTLDCSGI